MRSCNRCTPISWNSKPFLINECECAIQDGFLRHYVAIPHKGEYDYKSGDTDKDHFHLLFIPKGTIETDTLYKRFEERDPLNPLPICLHEDPYAPPQNARQEMRGIASWLLYAIHDSHFLECREMEREYHYKFTDFITDDNDWLNELFVYFSRKNGEFSHICRPKKDVLTDWLLDGKITLADAFRRKYITPLEYKAYKDALALYAYEKEKAEYDGLGNLGINNDTNYTLFLAQNRQKVNEVDTNGKN